VIKEFKDFINRGNLVDIAVAFVMGAAFASLITTFTDKIVNPLIGYVVSTGNLDGAIAFGKKDPTTGLQAGSLGSFIGAIINFLIVAFVMFLVVKAYNKMKAPAAEAAPAEPTEDVVLLRQIRDSLAK
jgi:large conductance mechanosensitive channel